jgi:hypothetical protein
MHDRQVAERVDPENCAAAYLPEVWIVLHAEVLSAREIASHPGSAVEISVTRLNEGSYRLIPVRAGEGV